MDMRICDEIYDAYLESTQKEPFTADVINSILHKRLHALLCQADGQLSAIRHGRTLTDHELEQVYYPIRDICDEISLGADDLVNRNRN